MACSIIPTLSGRLIAASSAASFSTARPRYRVGGWHPIKNLNDPKIQNVAKFALSEHNQRLGASLQLDRVLKGEEQVVAGMNYKLILAASSDGKLGKYEAVVWVRTWLNFKEVHFVTLIACSSLVLGFIEVPNDTKWMKIQDLNQPHVITIAKFAVKQHNKDVGTNLKFMDVLTGYRQAGEGMKYRLVVKALNRTGSSIAHFETLVHEQDVKEYKHLIYFRKP